MVTNTARIEPHEGWGFFEAIDGELASPFEIVVTGAGVEVGQPILGWTGNIIERGHKYEGMAVKMTSRHVDWTGIVALSVIDGETQIFSGLAGTEGLECNWK